MRTDDFLRGIAQIREDMQKRTNAWDALIAQAVLDLLDTSETVTRADLVQKIEALRSPDNEEWLDTSISVALEQLGK